MPDCILVTGATGTIGREVVKLLAARGAAVRALVHHPERAAAIQLPGVEIAGGDLDDPASVAAALAGVTHALLLTVTSPRRVEQEASFIAAAKNAGTRQVIKVSIVGASPVSPSHILRGHAEAEKILAASGLGFTVLRPNYFMQNLLWSLADIQARGVFNTSLPDDTRHSHVDARDIAAAAAAALMEPGHAGQVYHVTGPAALTYPEAAAALSRATGRPVRYDSSPQNYAALLAGFGMEAQDVLDLDTSIARGDGRGDEITDVVARLTGRPPIPFDRFAQDYAPIFLGR